MELSRSRVDLFRAKEEVDSSSLGYAHDSWQENQPLVVRRLSETSSSRDRRKDAAQHATAANTSDLVRRHLAFQHAGLN